MKAGRSGFQRFLGVATNNVAELTLNIPVEKMGMKAKKYEVEDLWNGGKKTVPAAEMKALKLSIKKDKILGGGIGVLKITPRNKE